MTNAPLVPSLRAPTPRCDRRETAPRKKDTRIPKPHTRQAGGPKEGKIPDRPMLAVSLTVGHAPLTGERHWTPKRAAWGTRIGIKG